MAFYLWPETINLEIWMVTSYWHFVDCPFWRLFVNYVGQMYEVCGLVIEHEIHTHFHENSVTSDDKILYPCRSEKSYLWMDNLVAAWFAVRLQ